MANAIADPMLSHLQTNWSLLAEAAGTGDEASLARLQLLERYYLAVKRYLERQLPGEPQAVSSILGAFCDGILEGHRLLTQADQKAGKFRNYLKRSLTNKIKDHYRKAPVGPLPSSSGGNSDTDPPPDPPVDVPWGDAILDRAWVALENYEKDTGKPFHTVCRCHYENGDMRSSQKAEIVSEQLGKTISADNFRQLVKRGQDQLADLLVLEVVEDLKPFAGNGPVSAEMLEEDLRELKLFGFCEAAVGRYLDEAKRVSQAQSSGP